MTDRQMIIENGVLVKYSGSERHVIIPIGVNRIGRSAFLRNHAVQTVIIPEGVTEISDAAFIACYGLKRVAIPGSVTRIGENAFSNCVKLENVEFTNGIRVIGDNAFLNCRLLKEAMLPHGLTVIGNSAFSGCIGLEKISISDSLTQIGRRAFYGCKLLKLAGMPNCAPEIGEEAFHDADPSIMKSFAAARKRLIPMYSACIVTVTELRRHKHADRLQCAQICGHNVIVDDTCRVGQRLVYFPMGGQLSEAFAKENRLLRYDEMGNRTGVYLHPIRRNITNVPIRGEISEGLALPIEVLEKYTDIHALKDGDRIFTLNGHPICSAYIPDEMDVDLRRKALVRCRGGRKTPEKVFIPWGTEAILDAAFMHSSHITEVVVPETVTSIGRRAFYDCPNLEKITIPDSVVHIGREAFAHCGRLGSIILPERLQQSADGIMNADDFEISDGTLIKYRGEFRNVIIPEGVAEIGKSAFWGSRFIESVVIPTSAVKIGAYAFEACKRLRKVTIPESVKYIGCEAFYKCRSLREVTIPPSVEYIGDHAFGVYFFYKYIEGFKFPREEYRKYDGFQIRCKRGSAAEAYAQKNDLSYRIYI